MNNYLALALTLLSGLTTSCCNAADVPWPMPNWPTADPADVGMDPAQLRKARDYALTGGGSGYITRHGRLVMSWGDPRARYDLKSTTKSIGVTALGLAIADGKMGLRDRVVQHHPTFALPPDSNKSTGWIERITIRNLATQTAGFVMNFIEFNIRVPGTCTFSLFYLNTKQLADH